MTGVDILNQTMITKIPDWYIAILVLSVIVIPILFMLSGWSDFKDWLQITFFFSGIVCFILFIVLLVIKYEEPVGRYRYEVTITEEASMVEIHERYDVIEKRGQIWILEDKKVEE